MPDVYEYAPKSHAPVAGLGFPNTSLHSGVRFPLQSDVRFLPFPMIVVDCAVGDPLEARFKDAL